MTNRLGNPVYQLVSCTRWCWRRNRRKRLGSAGLESPGSLVSLRGPVAAFPNAGHFVELSANQGCVFGEHCGSSRRCKETGENRNQAGGALARSGYLSICDQNLHNAILKEI